MGYSASFQARDQLQKTIIDSIDGAVKATNSGIIDAVALMHSEVFDNSIETAYIQYKLVDDKTDFHEVVTENLNRQYSGNDMFLTSMIYFLSEEDSIYYVGNNENENALEQVNVYREFVHSTVKKIDENLNDKVKFLSYDNTLYMIRTVYINDDDPLAVMVMEVNTQHFLRGLNSVVWLSGATVKIDKVKVNLTGISIYVASKSPEIDGVLYEDDGTFVRVQKDQMVDGYHVVYSIMINSAPLEYSFSVLERMLIPISLSIIPLLALAIWMFFKHISKPVESMVEAAGEIQKGKLGYQIIEKPRSKEFNYLVENFNNMSKNTKEQFERSYNEQVALQNERMKALQSQINPHFLNNTLEIINWEARIAKNELVCSMIDALGTMLSAAMLRSGKTKASLREELEVVDAYLHIIGIRMGDGLVVKKEVDESLLDVVVPCMILQPVVENAVEHGMTLPQKGELNIRIYKEKDNLIMEVENEGHFSADDQANIDRLLSWDCSGDDSAHSSEVGIRNVNYRLKLLYGDKMGLSIHRTKKDTTLAKMILPISQI